MSDVVIVLLLLVPIIVVVIILNNANKRRIKKAQKRINTYITEATRQTGITNYYRKQLVHQTLIIDEKGGKLLIVEHNGIFSFEVFQLDAVSGNIVVNIKQPFIIEGKEQKKEHITTRIGVELKFRKVEGARFLKLYDHLEHNVYMIADFEKEAHQIREKIEHARVGN
ncbi:hypothetical protein A4H97_22510 [Niastella yeongjuensis]|uniref:Uncharacterized protein n=1 Tax=Niastella yeongjuensis TaxID=354355 RepID=A0A1V9F7S5_9BACT|nr:hypothetical protein [Niastella yeongjuensis]OQP54266.1 hypothetical protein A4H97_22510 [Niastella yeongjuensis]SEP31084.1 hypothetical protein SAMN05660816_05209 [Niastella yeongjuensis]